MTLIAGDTNIDYNKPSTVLETYKEVLDTYNLKQHVKKPTRQGVKTIDHIVSNLETEKVLITDVLPCPTVSDHDARYAIIKIPTIPFQKRYKYIRNMKNFNTKEYFRLKYPSISNSLQFQQSRRSIGYAKQINFRLY